MTCHENVVLDAFYLRMRPGDVANADPTTFSRTLQEWREVRERLHVRAAELEAVRRWR